MKRQTTPQFKKASLILTADWHLREDTPICRTDDFQSAQWEKVDFISELQEKHDCLVIHSGDLFNHWKPSPYLLTKTIEHLPSNFYTIYGNHDLPQHNLQLIEKTGVHTLQTAMAVNTFKYIELTKAGFNIIGLNWGQTPEQIPEEFKGGVLVWHTMTWANDLPYPGCPDPSSLKILKKYKEYKLIVTGHNHKSFVTYEDDRILVNPGSLTRQDADQTDHMPCVFLWYAEDNSVQRVSLPYNDDVITRQHIENKEVRDNRITAFISRLNNDWKASVSFEHNIDIFFKENNIRESVKSIVLNAIES